jgi:transposase
MPRGKELTPYIRTKICEAKACGLTNKEIAHRHQVNIDTVKYTLKKERFRVENASRPRSGPPRKLNEHARDYLVDVAFHETPRITWRCLTAKAAEEVGESVHKRSVQRLFAQMNMRKWKCLWRPALLAEHVAKRLVWAQLYNPTDYPAPRWRRVKWSDECYVERGVGVRDEWVFCRPEERLDPANVQERPIPHGIKQMFWAAFGYEC